MQASASPAGLRLLWSSSVGGGPPIVAAGLIWTIGQDGDLYALDPSTGSVREQATVGVPANHFPTPSVGAGLLLAPGTDRVVAFSASSPAARTATTTTMAAGHTTTTARVTSTTAAPAGGSSDAGVTAAFVVGGLVVVGGLTWLLVRRRRATRGQ